MTLTTGPARCANCQAEVWRYPVHADSNLSPDKQRIVAWDETDEGRWILRAGHMSRLSGKPGPGEFKPHRCDGEASAWD